MFQPGDLVLRKVFKNTADLAARKFQPNWEGPYLVIQAGESGCSYLEISNSRRIFSRLAFSTQFTNLPLWFFPAPMIHNQLRIKINIHTHTLLNSTCPLHTPGKNYDWLTSNGSPGEPRVSSQGPLTSITPFASILGESGSPLTNCSRELWADMGIRPPCATLKE